MSAMPKLEPYQRVVAATGLSNLADGIRLVALPLVALEVSSSPLFLAAVLAAGVAPWIVLGVWAGSVTDRVDRIVLAQRTAALRVGLLSVLGVLILFDAVPQAVVLCAAFVLGASEVLTDNVNGALLPTLVAETELERANSQVVSAEIVGNELIGPAIGGVLFATAASLPFFTNAGLLAVAFLLLSGLPLLQLPTGEPARAETAHRGAFEGYSLLGASPMLLTITGSSALLAAVDGAWFSLLALLIIEQLGLSSAAFGVFLAIGAAGGLLGAFVAGRMPTVPLSTVAAAVFLLMALPLFALSAAPTTVVVAIALVVTSGAFAAWNVFMVSARQRASTPQTLGRIGASYRTIVVTAGLAGTLIGGLIAELSSIQLAFVCSAVTLCLATPAVVHSFRRPGAT